MVKLTLVSGDMSATSSSKKINRHLIRPNTHPRPTGKYFFKKTYHHIQ